MAYDWASRRKTASRMINKYGCPAILRRDSGDRECIACMVDYFARPHTGELRNAPDRVILVSAEGLDVPPDAEKDHLVWLDAETGAELENLRLIAPIGKIAPGGVVLYWELAARR